MNLHTKIIGSTLFLLLTIGLLTVFSMHALVSKRLEAELTKRGKSIAMHVASGSLEPLLTENSIALRLYVGQVLRQESDLLYIFVLDTADRVVAHTFEGGFPSELRSANRIEAGVPIRVQHLLTGDGEVYDIAVPVGGGGLGVARVGFSGDVVRQGVRSVVDLGVGLVIFILMIGGGVAVILDNTVLFPIARLTATAERISRGKHSERADIEGDDEVARLGSAFNSMLDELESSRRELTNSNAELEEEISSRRRAEETIRQHEEELRVIFESTPIMMALLDSEMRLRKVNRTWKAYVGGGRDSFGRSFGEALECVNALSSSGGCSTTEHCRGCLLRAALEGAVEKQVPVNQVEATLRRRDGDGTDEVHLLVSATPVSIGREELVLVSIEDITALKSTELRLQDAYADLEKQNEELKKVDVIKSALVRDVSHELKTPVAKFAMQLEILRKEYEGTPMDGTVGNCLRVMEGNVKRLEGVIGNILDLSRLEGGARKFNLADMRLDLLLEKVVAEFSHLLDTYGLEVESHLEETTIVSDEEMLWHVFSNLLGNAVKFTRGKPQGRIAVRCAGGDGWATVRVEDNGLGISKEGRVKAFGAFFQDTASSEGIGVGLSITKTIVEGLGGRVRLESEGRGRGATAVVDLPERAAVTETGSGGEVI